MTWSGAPRIMVETCNWPLRSHPNAVKAPVRGGAGSFVVTAECFVEAFRKDHRGRKSHMHSPAAKCRCEKTAGRSPDSRRAMMESPLKDRLPMQSTVAAMILVFVYRCGGSVGMAIEPGAPTSRLIPGLCSPRDTCRRGDRVSETSGDVNAHSSLWSSKPHCKTQAFISNLIWVW